jgi:hypothetical protein
LNNMSGYSAFTIFVLHIPKPISLMATIKVRFINNSDKYYELVIFQMKGDDKGENIAERAAYCGGIGSRYFQTVELEDTGDIWACVPGRSYEIGDIVDPADRRKLMQLTNVTRNQFEVSEMDQIRS